MKSQLWYLKWITHLEFAKVDKGMPFTEDIASDYLVYSTYNLGHVFTIGEYLNVGKGAANRISTEFFITNITDIFGEETIDKAKIVGYFKEPSFHTMNDALLLRVDETGHLGIPPFLQYSFKQDFLTMSGYVITTFYDMSGYMYQVKQDLYIEMERQQFDYLTFTFGKILDSWNNLK